MKKLCILILALLLTVSFSSFSITCYANGGSVTVNGASAKAGEEVTVKITAKDIKAVNSGSIEIKSLPDGVTVVSGTWKVNAYISAFDDSSKRGVFAFKDKNDVDGTIFELKLRLGKDAKSGDVVVEVRFKDGSAGKSDVAGIENIPGKLTVKSGDSAGATDTPTTNGDTATDDTATVAPDDDTATDDTPADDTTIDDVQINTGDDANDEISDEKNDEKNKDEGEGGKTKLSLVVIVLIAVAGVALIAAIVLLATKKKK